MDTSDSCQICGKGHREHNWNHQGHTWQCKCGSIETEFQNFDPVLREADIYCAGCGVYIRMWDPNI